LIVDDEAAVRHLLTSTFLANGYTCTAVGDAAEARRKLEDQVFDLVCLDIEMPGESGLSLLEYIKEKYPDVAVVMASVIQERETALRALELGAYGYVAKPFETNEIIISAANALRRRELEMSQKAYREDLERMVDKKTRALVESERRHRQLLDTIPDPVVAYDPEGKATYVNQSFVTTFGWSPQELLGRRIDFVPPDEQGATRRAWEGVFRGEDPVFETRRLTKDGGVIDVLIRGAFVADDRGEVVETVVINKDITERRSLQKEVEEEGQRLRLILDSIVAGIMIVDAQTHEIVDVNPVATRMIGLTQEEIVGRECFRFTCPTEKRKCPVTDLGQEIDHSERVLLTASGQEVPIIKSVATVEMQGRQHCLETFVDITERKAAEEALRESEDQYRTLVESLPTGFIRADENTNFLYFNDRLAEMLDYAPEELKGKQTLDFLDEANRRVLLHQTELRKKGKSDPYELAWTKKDGRQIHTMMYPKPVFSNDGDYRGSFVLVADVTDRKMLESQLLQAQKLESIGQLAAGIAHEINTPTQYVTDNTRFLQEAFDDLKAVLDKYTAVCRDMEDGPPAADLKADLESTLEEADVQYLTEEIPRAVSQSLEGLGRIGDIVRSMKEFAHPGPETKAPVDLNRAILSTITVARNEWKYVADVETDLDPGLPPVPCVAGEINQVVLNIIVNAAHAIAEVVNETSGEKGRILVSTRPDGDWAEIRVADTGPGVPPEIQDRVFDPFFTTKDPGKGTGQGLAIAYRVIREKHGGNLSLSSKPGQGTTFIIRLPLETGGAGDPR
jgi:PAS domain S-box-containing protein